MPRHELNKDNSNSHGKVDRGKFMRSQPYTKKPHATGKSKSGRNSLPCGGRIWAEYGESKNYNQNVLYLKIRTKKENAY